MDIKRLKLLNAGFYVTKANKNRRAWATCVMTCMFINKVVHSFLYIRTSSFGAEVESFDVTKTPIREKYVP